MRHELKAVAHVAIGIALAIMAIGSAHAADARLFITPGNDGSTATNGQILQFDSRIGSFGGVLAPSQGISQIQGLTFGPDGYLYGSYFNTNVNTDGRVLRVSLTGVVETFVVPGSGGLYSPLGLTFGPDGNLYVANNLGTVIQYNGATGAYIKLFAVGLSVPQDVAFGPDGNLYVSNGYGDSISRFDGATGTSLGYFVAPKAYGLDAPIGIAFGPSGDLYVASFPTNTIFRFDGASGVLVSKFDLPYQDGLDTLLDVAFGPDKKLYAYVREIGILRLDPDSGAVLNQFATMPVGRAFNTGMLFVDPDCSLLGSVKGGASGCFAGPPTLALTLKSSVVAGCKSVKGTVTLTAPAPAGGSVITLSDTLASAVTPAAATIPAGATTKTFTITTTAVAAQESGAVSATLAGQTLSQNLTVRPMGLASFTLSPATVVGGNVVSGTAKLECKAGPGAVAVDLTSTNTTIAYPVAASISVPQGLQAATFDVASNAVLAKSSAMITGTANGITKSKALTVNPAASVSPASVNFGAVTVGTTSPTLNATLTNQGAVPFWVISISLTGTYASWFAQTSNCPASLAAGASCSISVAFKPLAAASKSAKLSIATSATSAPLSVALAGKGI